MNVQNVNGVGTSGVNHLKNSATECPLVSFKSEHQADTVELSTQEKKPNKGKIALIAGGIVAAGVAAGLIIHKVKNGKKADVKDIKDVAEKASDAFKKIKADKITGKFATQTKGGGKVIMQYKDGVLQSSQALDKDGQELFTKVFEHFEDGKIKSVVKTQNGNKISEFVKTIENGVETAKSLDKDGNEISKLVTTIADNGDKTIQKFDKDGKEILNKVIKKVADAAE